MQMSSVRQQLVILANGWRYEVFGIGAACAPEYTPEYGRLSDADLYR